MIPLWDDIPRTRWPFVMFLLILANVVVFFLEVAAPPAERERLIAAYALIPARSTALLTGEPVGLSGGLLPLFTSMFLHGGWMHLIGNLWFLWLFGDNVEDRIGHGRFLLLYLAGGLAGALTHWLFNLNSVVPTVGASGAIAAVMGAYLITFPGARIRTLVPVFFFLTWFDLPAFVILFYWLLIQLLSGMASVAVADPMQGGVAFFAHVGGFLAGIPLMMLLRPRRRRRLLTW
ncbi:MAG TPA: rhomboid family intramembrane serine protease [Terriglobia bacterium]|nr:rhomboid family intramembrane serine protease [Terriglobia bacterium]